MIVNDTTKLFNVDITDIDISTNPLILKVKQFIMKINTITPELQRWATNLSTVIVSNVLPNESSSSSNFPENKDFKISSLMGQKPCFSSITSNTSYDISSEHLLTYTELRQISINIAKNLLSVQAKDETITMLELEKRRSLISEIQDYKRIRLFSAFEEDLQKMSLEQLEAYKILCEKELNKFKVDDILKSSFSLCSIGYNTIFPEGIPVGNGTKLEFGDVGSEIRNRFLDNRTPTGFSFARILSKYDLTISDELMLLITAGEIALKNIKFNSNKKAVETSRVSKKVSQPIEEEDEESIEDDVDNESTYNID
jgi:hypothetical protein